MSGVQRALGLIVVSTLGGCSILAPSDDDLLGGSGAADASAGGASGSAGSGGLAGAAAGSGTGGSAGGGGAAGTAGSGGAAGSRGGAAGAGGVSATGGAAGTTGGTSATGGSGGAATGGTGGGTGGTSATGCSDGTRETFKSETLYKDVAGCSGAWTVPGVLSGSSMTPACNRAAGNTGANPTGIGCSVADLCAQGWDVCAGKNELGSKSPSGCAADANNGLWIVREAMDTFATSCGLGGANQQNNVVGCGQGVGSPTPGSCAPLNRYFVIAECSGTPGWDCGSDPLAEALNVTKDSSQFGGVICCKE